MTPKSELVHACCPVIAGSGVLIRGESGSGKTALSLTLIRRCLQAGLDATLLADDHLFLEATPNGDLIARCPDQIAGLVEVRPYGLVKHGLAEVNSAPVRLVVDLVGDDAEIERMQSGNVIELKGLMLPVLKLQSRPAEADANAVFAAVGLPCWY